MQLELHRPPVNIVFSGISAISLKLSPLAYQKQEAQNLYHYSASEKRRKGHHLNYNYVAVRISAPSLYGIGLTLSKSGPSVFGRSLWEVGGSGLYHSQQGHEGQDHSGADFIT